MGGGGGDHGRQDRRRRFQRRHRAATATANTKVIDLQGKTVIPGITDGHVHLWFGALALHGFNLSTPESNITSKNPDLLLAKIKTYAASHPKDPVIFGRVQFITDFSASGNAFKKPTVTHELLDRAVPDRPLVIHDVSEHALWVNQKASGSGPYFGCSSPVFPIQPSKRIFCATRTAIGRAW